MKKVYKYILSIVLIFLSLYLLIELKNLNFVPTKYFFLLIVIIIILNVINITLLFLKKKIFKIIGLIMYILFLLILIISIYYSSNTKTFLNNSFDNYSSETTTYKVLVHDKSYTIKNIKNVGYFENDLLYKESLKKIKIKNYIGYDNLINLYENLIDDKINSIVLDDGYISILEEIYPNLKKDTKVIYTFKINKKIKKNYSSLSKLNPVNIYVSGSDSRENSMKEKSRTDVNMILTINPNNNTILITSIPRDYYVTLYGINSKDKLTHSGIYGIETSVKTIENLLDINIDYYIKVNFQSVISLVDLVGGIDIDSDLSFKTNCGDGGAKVTYVKKGINHFNGAQALSYARERYAYENGDRHRIQNTQQVFKATFEKILADKTILFKYEEFLNSLSGLYLTNIPSDYIKLLVKKQIVNMDSWNFNLTQIDGKGDKKETYSIPGYKTYVMIPYEDDIKRANENINKTKNASD